MATPPKSKTETGVDTSALDKLRLETEEAELRLRLQKARMELAEIRSSKRSAKPDAV